MQEEEAKMAEMPEGIGAVGSTIGGVGKVAGSALAAPPVTSSSEGLSVHKVPESVAEASEIPGSEPTGSEATGPDAANAILGMAKQGPETGMTQLADLDIDALDTETKQKPTIEDALPLTDEKPDIETTNTNGQSAEVTNIQGAQATEAQDADSVSGTAAEGMDADPRYKALVEEISLRYLRTQDAAWFNSMYSGIASSGYLLDRQGNETNFLPSQNITAGWGEVKTQAKAAFEQQFPDAAKTYSEKDGLQATNDSQLSPASEGSFQESESQDQRIVSDSSQPEKSSSAGETTTQTDPSISDEARDDPLFQQKLGEERAAAQARGEEIDEEKLSQETLAKYNQDKQVEQSQLTPEQQKISQLEQKLNNLVAENTELRNNIAQINEAFTQMKDILTTLVQSMAAKEKDPKEKESLIMLLAKIMAIIVIGSVIEGGKTVAPPLTQPGR